SPDMPLNRDVHVIFAFGNVGKTAGTIKEVNAVLRRSPQEPENIFINAPILNLPTETVVGPAEHSPAFKVETPEFFKLDEAIKVQNGEIGIWFYGRVVYDDVFGREGTQRFLYRLRNRGGFTRIYDKTEYRKI